MGTYAYMHWRREREARHRLTVAEVDRARQAQLVQTSKLLALQARIEPQFLFDALGRVRDALDRSVDVAEQRLADLITLLRSLQPATDATASSLGREFALVHAFGRAADLPADRSAPFSAAFSAVFSAVRSGALWAWPSAWALSASALAVSSPGSAYAILVFTPNSCSAIRARALSMSARTPSMSKEIRTEGLYASPLSSQ